MDGLCRPFRTDANPFKPLSLNQFIRSSKPFWIRHTQPSGSCDLFVSTFTSLLFFVVSSTQNPTTMKAFAIPDGFQLCPKGFNCPSCKSKLIKKMPTEVTLVTESVEDAAFDAAHNNCDYQSIKNSLESAQVANFLLQAMSFDAATREHVKEEEGGPDPVKGVPYCPQCKVHVITDPVELTTLFGGVATDDGDDDIESKLRGRLYVCVSEEDVASLAQRKEMGEPTCSYDIITPSTSEMPTGAAIDFDYDYRHSIATKSMGHRITKGYTLLEELCESCEMPLMQPPNCDDKECVVCPKLDKLRAKFTTAEGLPDFQLDANPTEDSFFEIDESDPVSLIIAEARRAIKTPFLAPNSPGGSTPLSPKTRVEEAKKFLTSKCKAHAQDTQSKDGTAPLTPDASKENTTVVPANTHQVANWDELLIKGRCLFSERVQEGWELSNENCIGEYCRNTPLLKEEEGAPLVCTVCSGSGNGQDGEYAQSPSTEVQWDDLVTSGRGILAERLRQGWTLSSENCNGFGCKGMPLTQCENGSLSCVVCGGSGSGFDGLYASMNSEVAETEREIGNLMMQMGPAVMDDMCFDNNANDAAQKIQLGWRLGEGTPLCCTCGGIQMIPPNSTDLGCINQACPVALPAALVSNPAFTPIMSEPTQAIKPHSHQRTGSEVLKKVTDKLSIGRLLKDGLVPLMVCGAPDYADDQSALSDDNSFIRSTTTNALGGILVRLEQAKYQLEILNAQGHYATEEAVMKQGEIAMLIEKLANAAVSMKQMEEIEAHDPPTLCM